MSFISFQINRLRHVCLSPPRIELIIQFGKFGVVGVIGLMVDTAVLYALLYGVGLGFYSARLLSYLVAATTTWALNRLFTFRDPRPDPLYKQWARFVTANAFGGGVNYAVYVVLIAFVPLCVAHPVLAVAAGSLAGMFLNFAASKALVFHGG